MLSLVLHFGERIQGQYGQGSRHLKVRVHGFANLNADRSSLIVFVLVKFGRIVTIASLPPPSGAHSNKEDARSLFIKDQELAPLVSFDTLMPCKAEDDCGGTLEFSLRALGSGRNILCVVVDAIALEESMPATVVSDVLGRLSPRSAPSITSCNLERCRLNDVGLVEEHASHFEACIAQQHASGPSLVPCHIFGTNAASNVRHQPSFCDIHEFYRAVSHVVLEPFIGNHTEVAIIKCHPPSTLIIK